MFADYLPRSADDVRGALPEGLRIRDVTADDVDGIAAILREREGGTFEAAKERAGKYLAAPVEKNRLMVADLDRQVIGHGRIGHVSKLLEAEYQSVPEGWYLTGVIVAQSYRRRGIAMELTRRRIAWVRGRAGKVFYFANSRNLASIELHRRLGFVEVCRNFKFPGATFSGDGVGILFRLDLASSREPLDVA